MVARLRHHCATCGVVFDAPSTWAYCSKFCERARTGRLAQQPGVLEAESLLQDIHVERMDIRKQIETAMPWERTKLLNWLRDNERREVIVADELAAMTDTARVEHWLPKLLAASDSFEVTMRRSLAAAMKLGQRLLDAKAAVRHGDFGRMFLDAEDPVQRPLPFTRSWGRKLMAIADHPTIVKRAHEHVLPADINTVYELTRLPAPELEAAIASGHVKPAMRREEVRRLVCHDASEDAAQAEAVQLTDDEVLTSLLHPIRVRLTAFAADHPELFEEARRRMKAIMRALGRAAAKEVA